MALLATHSNSVQVRCSHFTLALVQQYVLSSFSFPLISLLAESSLVELAEVMAHPMKAHWLEF